VKPKSSKQVKYTGNPNDDYRMGIHPAIGRYVLETSEIADIPFQSAVEMALCFGSAEILKTMKKINSSNKSKSNGKKGLPASRGELNLAICDSLMAAFGLHRVKLRKLKNGQTVEYFVTN
jgi:hypothetical protein